MNYLTEFDPYIDINFVNVQCKDFFPEVDVRR